MSSPPVVALDVAALAGRLDRLAGDGGRRIVVGIAGPPGVGKSTVAEQVVEACASPAVVLPLDGFHLPAAAIAGSPRADRRGAPDTFDPLAFIALLRLLRSRPDEPVTAPAFSRVIEDPVPDAITIAPTTRMVVVEGNYLLLDDEPWRQIAPLLDECWYLENDDDVRRARLVARHIAAGKEPAHALAWTHGTDESNAALIRSSRARADLVIRERLPRPGPNRFAR